MEVSKRVGAGPSLGRVNRAGLLQVVMAPMGKTGVPCYPSGSGSGEGER